MALDLNTHSYDGQLGPIYRRLKKKEDQFILDNDLTLLDMEACFALINGWINESTLNNRDKRFARETIQLIKKGSNNYDDKNDIDVCDLLPRVINIVMTYDKTGINVFLKTFGEIKQLGKCSQGRTTRLLQFYVPYHDKS